MKMKLVTVAMGLALGLGVVGCAHQGEVARSSADSDRYQYVTGSYLPQDVQKSGPVTNGKDSLRIIDRSEIDRSGGANVEQTLRNLGANH